MPAPLDLDCPPPHKVLRYAQRSREIRALRREQLGYAPTSRVSIYATLITLSALAVLLPFAFAQLSTMFARYPDFSAFTHAPLWLLAVALATFSAWFSLLRIRPWLTSLAIVAQVAVLHAIPTLAWPFPRLNTTWYHAGLAQYLLDGGAPDAALDVRFHWFAGFSLMGHLSHALGVEPLDLARGWSVVIELALAASVWALARAARVPVAASWAAAALTPAVMFTGQSYMSPQSLAIIVFLGLVSLMIYRASPTTVRPDVGLWVPGLVLVGAITLSHQYTTLMAAAALVLLPLFPRLRGLWLFSLAGMFLIGVHTVLVALDPTVIDASLQDVGQVASSFDRSVSDRFVEEAQRLDPWRVWSVLSRTALAALVVGAGTASLGWLVAYKRTRMRAWPVAGLFACALGAGLVTPYGGESLIRAYLFASGFAVIGLAWAAIGSRFGAAFLALFFAVCTVLLLPARWGNDIFDRHTPEQYALAAWVEQNIDDGDRAVMLDRAMPIRDTRPFRLDWRFPPESTLTDPVLLADFLMEGDTGNGYMLMSLSSALSRAAVRSGDPMLYPRVMQALRSDPGFVQVAQFGPTESIWTYRESSSLSPLGGGQ